MTFRVPTRTAVDPCVDQASQIADHCSAGMPGTVLLTISARYLRGDVVEVEAEPVGVGQRVQGGAATGDPYRWQGRTVGQDETVLTAVTEVPAVELADDQPVTIGTITAVQRDRRSLTARARTPDATRFCQPVGVSPSVRITGSPSSSTRAAAIPIRL
jgi:hypothetical protein